MYFNPITHGVTTMEMLLDVTSSNYLPSGYFPFADAGEITFCIDTKSSTSKVYRLTEDGVAAEVSNSFSDFMDLLSD